MTYHQERKLMSCYIEDPTAESEEPTKEGLLKGHAYAITGVCEVGANRLLQIRNPHGNRGWSGAWHDLKEEVRDMNGTYLSADSLLCLIHRLLAATWKMMANFT